MRKYLGGLCICHCYQHFKLLKEIIMVKLILKLTQFFVAAAVYYKGEIDIIYPAWKRRSAEALTLGFLLCLLVPIASAQDMSRDKPEQITSESSTDTKTEGCVQKIVENIKEKIGTKEKSPLCIASKIESLRPRLIGRFARGFQYDYKLTQQQGTVLVNSGSGNGAITAFLRNPQNYLQQHTLTFKFAEMFPDSLSLFKRGSDYLKIHPKAAGNSEELSDIFCKGKPLISCLAKGGSWWQRALMGTSINLNFTERTLVQQQVIASPVVFGQKYLVNAGFTFDPAKIFISAGSWKSAFDKVQEVDKMLALIKANDELFTDEGDIKVRRKQKPWKQSWATVLVPKVELKVLSQFDYVKHQGLLIDAPFPERALNNWTFTWDLTRAIPDTKSRIDADAVYGAVEELEKNFGKVESTWVKQCYLYYDEKEKPGREIDVHPALFSASSCQNLAKVMKAEYYQLSCVFKGEEAEKVKPDKGMKKKREEDPDLPSVNECGWKWKKQNSTK